MLQKSFDISNFQLRNGFSCKITLVERECEIGSSAAVEQFLNESAKVEPDRIKDLTVRSHLELQMVLAHDSRGAVDLDVARHEHRAHVPGPERSKLVQDAHEFWRHLTEPDLSIDFDFRRQEVTRE